MTESPHDPAPDADPRWRVWLREATEKNDSHPTGGHPADDVELLARVRRTLLARLASGHVFSSPPAASTSFLLRHRFALGGLAASLAIVAALLIGLSSGVQLSAMERMAKKLQQISAYSYRLGGENSGVDDDDKRKTYKIDEIIYWLAPDAYYAETKIVEISRDPDGGNRSEVVLARFDEIFAPGGSGVFIDHLYKTAVRCRYEPSDESARIYPWSMLRMIQVGSYDVLADLGTRLIDDHQVQGYRLKLIKRIDRDFDYDDPVDLWVDPKTDLPVEFSWVQEGEGWKEINRATDFHWNIPLEAKLFDPVVPKGYADITAPTDQADLDQIVAALRIYSDLSGGHYPRIKKFTAALVHEDMLRLADAAETAEVRTKKSAEIEKAMPGMNWIDRIVRNRFVSGYRGATVGPADKDQLLLWWPMPDEGYRVIYGDLRIEVISDEQWSKLVPQRERLDYQKIE
jgi:hypothetical protein